MEDKRFSCAAGVFVLGCCRRVPRAAASLGAVSKGGPGLLSTGWRSFKDSLCVGRSRLIEIGIVVLIPEALFCSIWYLFDQVLSGDLLPCFSQCLPRVVLL